MTVPGGSYLDGILADKRAELKGSSGTDAELAARVARLPPPRDFAAALRDAHDVQVIAEFKRASPSEGPIRPDADPRAIAMQYVEAGAAAISVLTDRHFSGSFDDLQQVRRAVAVPLLCKDFILERRQVLWAREAGADAVLLIVAALEPPRLRNLLEFVHGLGMQALVEAHDAHEVDRALAAGAQIVGVNARDLRTFVVDLEVVVQLRKQVPRSFVFVGESGIQTRDDVRRLRAAEVDAILVGTQLMRADDPAAMLRELRRIGP